MPKFNADADVLLRIYGLPAEDEDVAHDLVFDCLLGQTFELEVGDTRVTIEIDRVKEIDHIDQLDKPDDDVRF